VAALVFVDPNYRIYVKTGR